MYNFDFQRDLRSHTHCRNDWAHDRHPEKSYTDMRERDTSALPRSEIHVDYRDPVNSIPLQNYLGQPGSGDCRFQYPDQIRAQIYGVMDKYPREAPLVYNSYRPAPYYPQFQQVDPKQVQAGYFNAGYRADGTSLYVGSADKHDFMELEGRRAYGHGNGNRDKRAKDQAMYAGCSVVYPYTALQPSAYSPYASSTPINTQTVKIDGIGYHYNPQGQDRSDKMPMNIPSVPINSTNKFAPYRTDPIPPRGFMKKE